MSDPSLHQNFNLTSNFSHNLFDHGTIKPLKPQIRNSSFPQSTDTHPLLAKQEPQMSNRDPREAKTYNLNINNHQYQGINKQIKQIKNPIQSSPKNLNNTPSRLPFYPKQPTLPQYHIFNHNPDNNTTNLISNTTNNIHNSITANAVTHQQSFPSFPIQNTMNNTTNIPYMPHNRHRSASASTSASSSASSTSFSARARRHSNLFQYGEEEELQNNNANEQEHKTPNTRQSRTQSLPHRELTEQEQKFNYHYNLLVYMRHPAQHQPIAYDAQISGLFISIWCIFNMFFGFSSNPSLQTIATNTPSNQNVNVLSMAAYQSNVEKIYQRQEIFNNLLVFLIAVLVIHKDIILCNAQLCMPMLLLFNFTIRFTIELIMKFEASWDSVNCVVILVILWFICCRFFFNIFKSSKYDIHWNLMRCHFFYRGGWIRWISYLIYSWFNALMVLQLMDSVCLTDNSLKMKLCPKVRIQFIGCDMVIVIYCIMVLAIWNKLQQIDDEKLMIESKCKLTVKSHGIKEIFIFIAMLIITNFLCETFLSKLVIKKMMLPFTVVVILIANFLMR